MTSLVTVGAANQLSAVRIIVPTTGTLHDLAVYVGAQSGNVSLAVYDTASPRNRLATSGAVACPAAGAWRVIFDPNLPVTAGDMYDFALTADNNLATFGRGGQLGATTQSPLPPNYLIAAGGAPWLNYLVAAAHPAPVTIAEASFVGSNTVHCIIGRIS